MDDLPSSLTGNEPFDPRPGHRPWEVGDEYDRANGYVLCQDWTGQDVLRNLVGAWDNEHLSEYDYQYAEIRAHALTPPADGRFDADHLKDVHRTLFGGVYPWAGELRTIPIAKQDTVFTPPELLDQGLALWSDRLADLNYLRGMDREAFVEELGVQVTALNLMHPFREGNGRTQEAFWSQVAEQAGYAIDWQQLARDKQRYMEASEVACAGNRGPLTELLSEVTHPLPRGGSQQLSPAEQHVANLARIASGPTGPAAPGRAGGHPATQ